MQPMEVYIQELMEPGYKVVTKEGKTFICEDLTEVVETIKTLNDE